MQPRRCLIWDFDGTLAYLPGMWSGTLMEVLRRGGLEEMATPDDVRPYLRDGFPWHRPEEPHAFLASADDWWRALHPLFARALRDGVGLDAQRAHELAASVRDVYVDASRWSVFDDVQPALATLAEDGWQHVVLSNHVPELDSLIDALGLRRHFTAVFNSALTGYEKPNPESFRAVLNTLPKDAEVCVVGDNIEADIKGAVAVGLRAILVRRAHPDAPEQCESLRELPALL